MSSSRVSRLLSGLQVEASLSLITDAISSVRVRHKPQKHPNRFPLANTPPLFNPPLPNDYSRSISHVKQSPDISEAALLELVQESVMEADALFGPAFRKQTRKVRGRLALLNKIFYPEHVSSRCPLPPNFFATAPSWGRFGL